VTEDSDSEEVDSPAIQETDTASPTAPEHPREGVDRVAESFLDLESELAGGDLSAPVWGQAVDAERIPATDVPEAYPVEVTTDEALALYLDVDGRRGAVYFEWAEGERDDRLGRLLALKGISPDRFAELYGQRLLLDVEDGHYVPIVPDEQPRGSARGVYGIGAALALNLLTAALAAIGLGGPLSSVPFVVLWLLVNLLVLPAATYLDAWDRRTRTDWDGGPLFWASLAAIPGVNVLSSVLYLGGRLRATPLG
jgi:hypothetical protein